MDCVFNPKDLEKAVADCDDIAVTVLWNKTKQELQAMTCYVPRPREGDEVVATDNEIVQVHTFGYDVLSIVGVDFKDQAELCRALNQNYGDFITGKKERALKAA